MTRNDTGLFELRTGPLPSEMYVYTSIVDGVPMLDPGNNLVTGNWAKVIHCCARRSLV
jgi:hypothetical protein